MYAYGIKDTWDSQGGKSVINASYYYMIWHGLRGLHGFSKS